MQASAAVVLRVRSQQYVDRLEQWPANISPGVYCKGLAITNGAIVTMNPGVYIIDRGTFDRRRGRAIDREGVTIFLTPSTGKNLRRCRHRQWRPVNLTAPTSGATAGLVFFGDRDGPLNNTTPIRRRRRDEHHGSDLFSVAKVTFDNGISNPSGCTQLIAGNIKFTGGARFQNDCANTGMSPIGGSTTQLVE